MRDEKNRAAFKSTAFLIEMLVVVLFFSIACTVTLRLFGQAKQRQQENALLSSALLRTQSAAESLKGWDGSKPIDGLLPNFTWQGGVGVCRYDASFFPTAEGDAPFYLMVQQGQQEGTVLPFTLSFYEKGEDVPAYTLTVLCHLPARADKGVAS